MKICFVIVFSFLIVTKVNAQSFDSTYYNYLKSIVYENLSYKLIKVIPKTRSQYSIFFDADGLSTNRFYEIQQEVDEYVIQTRDSLYVEYYLLLAEYADGYVAEVYFGWIEKAFEENPLVKQVLCTKIKQKNPYVFKRLSYLFGDYKKDD